MGEMLEYSKNFWSGDIQVSVMVHRKLRASTSFLSRQLLFTSNSRTRRSCWKPAAPPANRVNDNSGTNAYDCNDHDDIDTNSSSSNHVCYRILLGAHRWVTRVLIGSKGGP